MALEPGLRLFSAETPAVIRRRRLVFMGLWGAVWAMVLWPLYPLFSGIRPLIFGLPLGLAWVLGAMLLMFGALAWLYWHDEVRPERGAGTSDGGS